MRRANLLNRACRGSSSISAHVMPASGSSARGLLLPRAAGTRSPLRRLLYLCSGVFTSASRESRPRGPLNNRRPSRTPTIHDIWVEECGSFCRAADLVLCRPSG